MITWSGTREVLVNFFLHEFGITIHDCITYKQLKLLCELLIPHAKSITIPMVFLKILKDGKGVNNERSN